MKHVIVDLSDMSDSKEFLNAKPKTFLNVFLYIVIALFASAIVWSYFGKMEIYATSSGIIKPLNVNVVKNLVAGKVSSTNIDEGKIVKKGDTLFTINKDDLQLNLDNYNEKLATTITENENLQKEKLCIEQEKNLFKKSNCTEEFYYYQIEKYFADNQSYIDQSSQNKYATTSDKQLTAVKLKASESDLVTFNSDLDKLTRYLQSITDNKNLFTEQEADYYSKYSNYSYSLGVYENNLSLAQAILDKQKRLYTSGNLAKNDLQTAQNAYDKATNDLDQFKMNERLTTQSNITSLKKNYNTISSNIDTLKQQIAVDENKVIDPTTSINQNKTTLLTQIENTIKTNKDSIQTLNDNIKTVKLNMQNTNIKADLDGVISIIKKISIGDYLQNGEEIVTILPHIGNTFSTEIYVSNKDISSISVGQEIKFKFDAMPYQDYGTVIGKVTKISTNATQNSSNNQTYYIVEAEVPNKPLKGRNSQEKYIKVGMTAQANFVKRQERVLMWFLDKINIIHLKY